MIFGHSHPLASDLSKLIAPPSSTASYATLWSPLKNTLPPGVIGRSADMVGPFFLYISLLIRSDYHPRIPAYIRPTVELSPSLRMEENFTHSIESLRRFSWFPNDVFPSPLVAISNVISRKYLSNSRVTKSGLNSRFNAFEVIRSNH